MHSIVFFLYVLKAKWEQISAAWLEKSFIRVYHKTQNQNKRRRKRSQHKTLLSFEELNKCKMQFPKSMWHVLRLTLVNIGGPDASPPYSEDTGLCIWSTETFQSDGPAACRDVHVCRLFFLPLVRAETEPGPGWSDEDGLRGFWARTSGSSGTSTWSFSEL